MVNTNYVLLKVKSKVNKLNELSYDEFRELFGCLDEEDLKSVINILDENNINCVAVKTDCASLNNVKDTTKYTGDFHKLLKISNETLCNMYQNGNETALAALVEKNKKLVFKVAMTLRRQFSRTNFTEEDLIQEGNIGLMKAAKKFNNNFDTRFTTYAVYWIEQNIRRKAVDDGYLIRLPVHMYEKIHKVFICRLQHPGANAQEISKLLSDEMTIDEISRCYFYIDIYLNTTSLNVAVGEDSETELLDLLPNENEKSVEENAAEIQLKEIIEKILVNLKPKEQKVIRLRYGLEDGIPRTLECIGDCFGVTRERIRQIESKALAKLRRPSTKSALRGFDDF